MRTPGAILFFVSLLGCGARSPLESSETCEEDACDRPRVEECDRLAKEATPLAVLHAGFGAFVLDEGAIYYVSDRRFYRLPLDAGQAEAIGPTPDSDETGPEWFDVGFGTIAWLDGHDLRAMSTDGSESRTLATMDEDQRLVVVTRDRVVTSGAGVDPSSVYSVPLAGGAPTKIIDALTAHAAKRDDATNQVFFATAQGLIAIDPATGAQTTWRTAPTTLSPTISGGGIFLLSNAIRARGPLGTPGAGVLGIFELGAPNHARQLASGNFMTIGADDDGVAFDGALGAKLSGHGSIGYAPVAGAPIELAESDTTLHGAGAQAFSTSIASDGTFVYWLSVCVEPENQSPREYRLVRIAKP